MQYAMINGEFYEEQTACVHVRDLAIQRGYGIFDFFKVVHGAPVYLDEHLQRFYQSAHTMRLAAPEEIILKGNIAAFIHKNNLLNGGVRLTLTGGKSDDGYSISSPNLIITGSAFQHPSEQDFEKGISLISYEYRRQFPTVKTIDYVMAVWLQQKIRDMHADDVLYSDEGAFTECPRSNFFLVMQDGLIITAEKGILAGVTRKKILQLAQQALPVQTRMITRQDIHEAKEAFITSTTKMILPVNRIDERKFDVPGDITRKIFSLLLKLQHESTVASV